MYPNDPTGQAALSIDPNLSALGEPDCYTPNHRDSSYCGIQIFWFLSSVTTHTAVFDMVWLQLGWYHMARQHYTCSEAFTVLGIHCLSQCATGLHDQTARTVSKARETATYWLEFSDTPVYSIVEKHSRLLHVIWHCFWNVEKTVGDALSVLYPLPVCFFTLTLAGIKFGTEELEFSALDSRSCWL